MTYYENVMNYIKEFKKNPLQTSLITVGCIVFITLIILLVKRIEEKKKS